MPWVGGTVEKQVTFKDTNGLLADPTVVNANAKNPNGASVSGTVVHQSLGVYDALFVGNIPGLWFYRIEGEGNDVDVVVEGTFCIQESSVE